MDNNTQTINNTKVHIFNDIYDPKIHGEFDQKFEETYNQTSYNWDDFQLHSFQAINRNDDVLVSAPTSSGKSHVGWYALKRHLFNNPNKNSRKKIVYTSPIKTLSNEKFEEMTEYLTPYGIEPGLLTGDHKVNVESDFLIMTAEILANALFRLKDDKNSNESKSNQFELDTEFVNSISCVIMDEIHFISDESRGYVWEESIILLDPVIQLIGLSATIDDPQNFANWISSIRNKPISLIMKYDRPVPLEYQIYDGSTTHVVMDIDNTYNNDSWKIASKNVKELENIHNKNKTDMKLDMLRSFINYAEDNNLMQLCFIIFSKRNCERFAEQVNRSLLTGKESSQAVKALELKLGTHLKVQQSMPRFRQIKKLIQNGVCFHHAGMPVILKEVVEYLYKNGYIKVLFATETVAIGVNMPVRTIVYISLEKASGKSEDGQGSSIRYLNAAEFKQICGRAGRRGKDTRGTIVFLPIYKIPDERTVKNDLIYGPMPKIVSKLDLTYHSYLRTEVSGIIDKDDYFNKSLLKINTVKMGKQGLEELENVKLKQDAITKNHDILLSSSSITESEYQTIKQYLKSTDNENIQFAGFKVKSTKQQRKNLENMKKVSDNFPEITYVLRELKFNSEQLLRIQQQADYYTLYKEDRYSQIRGFLRKMEYLDYEYNITKYGVMVAHINECNPFILVEIFTGDILQNLEPIEIVEVCTILTDPITSQNKNIKTLNSLNTSNAVKESINYLQNRIEVYKETEKELYLDDSNSDWSISLDYVELTKTWFELDIEKDSHSKILELLNIVEEYEGSFIKNILKINTIIGNIISLANLTNNLELVPVLELIEPLLIKGMVNTDSLHVNI